jgi:hypothetical protein
LANDFFSLERAFSMDFPMAPIYLRMRGGGFNQSGSQKTDNKYLADRCALHTDG